MSLTPEAAQALYADPNGLSLADQLTAAYERNVAEGSALAPTIGDSLASVAAVAIIEAQATDQNAVPLPNLSPGFKSVLETSHDAARELFSKCGLLTPEAHDFVQAGIDFEKLDTAHETMTRLGMAPELVLAPVLELTQWQELYQGLKDDRSVNADKRIDGGLYVNDDVIAHWDELQANDHSVDIAGQAWQMLVLPGTAGPALTSIDHNGIANGGAFIAFQLSELLTALDGDIQALHPTIASYLALQAGRLQQGRTPIDRNTWSWLDGVFNGGSGGSLRAPVGHWSSDFGQVIVHWSNVGYRAADLGVRSPVWGT